LKRALKTQTARKSGYKNIKAVLGNELPGEIRQDVAFQLALCGGECYLLCSHLLAAGDCSGAPGADYAKKNAARVDEHNGQYANPPLNTRMKQQRVQ